MNPIAASGNQVGRLSRIVCHASTRASVSHDRRRGRSAVEAPAKLMAGTGTGSRGVRSHPHDLMGTVETAAGNGDSSETCREFDDVSFLVSK
jgi:hypothetical protein